MAYLLFMLSNKAFFIKTLFKLILKKKDSNYQSIFSTFTQWKRSIIYYEAKILMFFRFTL